ncbi:tetratricopeptide repeat protein [Lyngbya sp. CCY1209]|uniref:CHAT domain-containing protein n=1 Tax=Lyngbya sp. CCY1209 TaxID=2886103 RepID=UPI002D1FE282|nr:tetratricopeptide repeat protein [Lyngbya sp. CCY1209]MEB3885150.1 tetratricopeptide repeat protein [Lyngbya sp. CCY1209]
MTDNSQGSGNQPPNRFIIQHWIKRGVEFQNNGKFHHALSCFVRVLELSPNRIDIWYKVGVCWQNLGYFGDAIASYNACYQRSQTQNNLWLQAASQLCSGQCYANWQQQDNAVSAYSLAYQLFNQIGNNPHTQQAWDYLNGVGNSFLNNKQFQEAALFYQKLLKIVKPTQDRPKLGWVWHGLGRGFSGDGLDELAVECHRKMLEISRDLSDGQMEGTALYWLAWESGKLGQLADTIAYYEGAIGVYEKQEEGKGWVGVILNYLVDLYQKIGEFEKAIAVLEKRLAILRESQDKSGEYGLLYQIGGIYYNKLKDCDRAFDYYQSALEVAQGLTEKQPEKEANAYYMLGLISDTLNQSEDAISYFEEAIGYYEQDDSQQQWFVKSLDHLEKLYEKIGDYQKLIEVAEKRLIRLREGEDKSGEYEVLYKIAGLYYRKLNDYDRAFDYYHSALEVAQDLTERQPLSKANAYYMLGLMCHSLKKWEEGLSNYREASKIYTELGNQEWVEHSRKEIQKLEKFLARRLSASLPESDPQLDFLLNVLQATADSKGDAKVVYPLLEQNLDKFDENLADILRTWATAKFKEVSTETAVSIALSIAKFGDLIEQFPLVQPADNLEILIACYEATLEVYTRTTSPQYWAATQNLLAIAYCDSIRGERAENIEKAIACSKQALEVYTRTAYPEKWAGTQNLLASAYRNRIRGEKAENIEMAIACYELALEVRTRTAYPEKWAMTQMNLGAAYNDRIRGERAENIEKAIACYELALEVYTHTAYPKQWAATQNNLASAYSDRIRGEQTENTEKAIAILEKQLPILRDSQDQLGEYDLLYEIGGLYYNKLKDCDRAFDYYHSALEVAQDLRQPLSKANAYYMLGLICHSLKRWEEGLSNYREALRLYTELGNKKLVKCSREKVQDLEEFLGYRSSNFIFFSGCHLDFLLDVVQATADSNGDRQIVYPLLEKNLDKLDENLADILRDWATTRFKKVPKETAAFIASNIISFGNLIAQFPLGNSAKNLEIAIACYEVVLEVYTRTTYPEQWAGTQNNLAIAYNNRIWGKRAENIEIAIAYYEAALKVRTHTAYPEYWAQTQNNLAVAYFDRIRGERAENIEIAIACSKLALEVYTQTAYPKGWAVTQNNLAIAYYSRIRGERAENIEIAIACYEAALKVRTRTAFREDWAQTQNNLGAAYFDRIRGKRAENIEIAIACYEAALKVRTRTAYPQYWADTQSNLAVAYKNRIRGERAENIEKAISFYDLALEVYTRTAYPEQWAKTQNNLGVAYSNRIRGERAENIEIAIAYYQAALEVRTRTAYPEQWAETQNNLGVACKNRIRGKRGENLEIAIACYKLALTVRTHQAFPYNYVGILFNLGLAYQQLQQWQLAYDTFYNAIETVEDIRAGIVKGGDAAKQKLAEEWQKLYQAMVEVCIELKNYTAAIEYADRSKTRNLVELLATRDLYPKGDIPPEVLDELTRLRQEIETEQRRLEIEERSRDSFGGGMMGERSPQITDIKTTPPDRSHLNQLQQQLDDLINGEITPIDPDFRRTQKVEPIPFAEIQALTGENTAILEWYILSDRFLVFIVTPPTKPTATDGEAVTLWQSNSEDYQQLIKWANDYLNSYRNRESAEWKNSLTSRLQQLGEILHINELIATIEKTAKKCDRLVLIPNRFLHLFPLHALPLSQTGEDITYLMDRFSGGVSYAPSCQLLQTANNRQCPDFSQLLAIQNPTQDLEYTDLEVDSIRNYFNSSDILAKKEAKKSTFDSQQKTAHCNHFACHGYFNFENPLLSALLLSDCYLEPPPTTLDRSQHLPLNNNKTVDLSQCLTLGDVFTLDLRSCRLVTLSACETGLIDILSNSDEYIGLPSGFLVAGSTNVISSLWAVSDISTALLMIRFYQLLREGEEVAIALNHAQNWLRNATKSELLDWIDAKNKMRLRLGLQRIPDEAKPFESPYYWAAFCAVGKF